MRLVMVIAYMFAFEWLQLSMQVHAILLQGKIKISFLLSHLPAKYNNWLFSRLLVRTRAHVGQRGTKWDYVGREESHFKS